MVGLVQRRLDGLEGRFGRAHLRLDLGGRQARRRRLLRLDLGQPGPHLLLGRVQCAQLVRDLGALLGQLPDLGLDRGMGGERGAQLGLGGVDRAGGSRLGRGRPSAERRPLLPGGGEGPLLRREPLAAGTGVGEGRLGVAEVTDQLLILIVQPRPVRLEPGGLLQGGATALAEAGVLGRQRCLALAQLGERRRGPVALGARRGEAGRAGLDHGLALAQTRSAASRSARAICQRRVRSAASVSRRAALSSR